MAESFQPDEFDERPAKGGRVGAHRQRQLKGRAWIILGSCLVVAALIAGVGFSILNLVREGNQFEWDGSGLFGDSSSVAAESGASDSSQSADAAASESVASASDAPSSSAAEVDKSVSVRVLNGTATSGLAASAKTTLTQAGWSSVVAANASSKTSTSTVLYGETSLKDAAGSVADALGIASVKYSGGVGTLISVTLGSDFSG